MISLRRTAISPELIKSQLFDEASFYRQFAKDLKRASNSVIIESPYLTTVRSRRFAKLFKKLKKRGVKVRIYTREPYHHPPRLRQQAIRSAKILKSSGVRIIACSDLRHRKSAVIDKQILYEGSLNILSQSRSREVMRRTDSPQLCRQMLNFTGLNRRHW